MAEIVLRLKVAGQADVQQALNALGANTEQVRQTVENQTSAFTKSRMVLVEFGRALAGTAAVASLLAKSNPELQRTLEVVSLASSGLGTSLRALAAVMRAVISTIGWQVTALIGAVAAIIFLVRHWDEAKAAIGRAVAAIGKVISEVFAGARAVFEGFVQVLAGLLSGNMDRVREGVAQMQAGFAQIKTVVVDVTQAAINLGKQGLEFLAKQFGLAKTAVEEFGGAAAISLRQLEARWVALGKAVEDANAKQKQAAQDSERALFDIGIQAKNTYQEIVNDAEDAAQVQATAAADAAIMAKNAYVEMQNAVEDAALEAQQNLTAGLETELQGILKVTTQGTDIWSQLWVAAANKAIEQLGLVRAAAGIIGGILHVALGWLIPGLQHGGIVTRPTLAMVGETGPEAVIPLSHPKAGSVLGGNTYNVNFSGVFSGDRLAFRDLARDFMREIREESGRR